MSRDPAWGSLHAMLSWLDILAPNAALALHLLGPPRLWQLAVLPAAALLAFVAGLAADAASAKGKD